MQPFLDAVRKACLPAIWGQGVKLAREKCVTRSSQGTSEVTLRVRAPGHAIAPTVTLYLDDQEWSCDCGGKTDPCPHVAAAAIALQAGDAAEGTGAQAEDDARARLVYRFTKKERRLALDRVVIHPGGREEKIGATLTSGLAKGRAPAGLEPTHDDLIVDRIVGSPAREIVPAGRIAEVFRALSSDAEVFFEGQPIKVSGEPVLPRAVVEDAPGGGFVLRIEKDPTIEEIVSMGVVRCSGVLRPLTEVETTGEFPGMRGFAPGMRGLRLHALGVPSSPDRETLAFRRQRRRALPNEPLWRRKQT